MVFLENLTKFHRCPSACVFVPKHISTHRMFAYFGIRTCVIERKINETKQRHGHYTTNIRTDSQLPECADQQSCVQQTLKS